MNDKDKVAVENLIIVARYIQDNSIMRQKDELLLEKSIARCEALIGKSIERHEAIDLCEEKDLNIKAYLEAIKRRKKS